MPVLSEQLSAALDLFVRRLQSRSVVVTADCDALLQLHGQVQFVRPHEEFVRLGEEMSQACLVAAGVVARFAQLEDGRRQIIGLHIPGDMVDLYSLMLPRAPSALQALTASTIVRIPHAPLRDMAFEHASLAAALWRDSLVDGGIVSQWLLSVGRRNARERTAHLFCEMAIRYAMIGECQANRYTLQVTQEQLADALGLTPVHVNRSLRALRQEGLLHFLRGQVIILDWPGLARLAEFDPSYLHASGPPDQVARRTASWLAAIA